MGAPKMPDLPAAPPPPPTPAMQPPRMPTGNAKLGGTFLTAAMPSGPPLTKGRRTLGGE